MNCAVSSPDLEKLVQRLDRLSTKAGSTARRIEWATGTLLIAVAFAGVLFYGARDSSAVGRFVFVLAIGFQSALLGGALGRWKARADLPKIVRNLLSEDADASNVKE